MKKTSLIVTLLVAVFFISCNNEKNNSENDSTRTIILKTADESPSIVEIGDGTNFYCEPVSIGKYEYFVQHSTMSCPKIEKGVLRNCYQLDGYYNIFCPTCMNDWLISKFNKRFFPNGYK